MNKKAYRLVYSRLHGDVVAVEETATAAGKSASGESRAGRSTLGGSGHLIAATLLAVSPAIVSAQIAPTPGASTHVIQTQNGLPQVNIAAPSGAGVSVNTYNQFDVQKNGAILNNSPTIVSTQQAGYINGNPNFGPGQSARIIVNQVNSANPSQLRGYVEVAGNRAEVVLANPAGIVVDGGGFINTSRATLTTGRPYYGADGSLAGYTVNRGLVTVQGAGLNATNVDQVDLIARTVQANAAIHAKNLNVITGANQVNRDSLSTTPIAGDGPAPGVSIDVSQLGGMYANRIVLVGTENGVGVNNAGVLAAQAGDLTLTSQGKLVLTGKTSATDNLLLAGQDGIDNSGTTGGRQGVSVSTSGQMSNSGSMTAQQNLTVNAGSVQSSGTLGAGVNADGTIANSGDLVVATSGQLTATGHTVSGGNASLTGSGIDASGSRTGANGTLTLEAKAGDLNLSGATTSAQGKLTAKATGALNNDRGTLSSQSGVEISAGSVSARAGTMTTPGALTVKSAGAFVSDGGSLNAQSLVVNAGSVSNEGGEWVSQSTTQVQAGALANIRGTIQSTGALTIDGSSLDNTTGRIVSLNGDELKLTTTGQLTNVKGTTAAGDQGGVIGGNGNVTVNADALVNSGSITAKNALRVSGQAINNDRGTLIGKTADLATSGALSNQGGWIESLGAATLKAGALTNQQGTVQSGGALTVDGNSLDNTAGRIVSLNGDELKLTTKGQFTNARGTTAAGDKGGVIGGNGNVTVNADALVNSGSITAKNVLRVSGQAINNDRGTLAGQTVELTTAGTLSNQRGSIESQGAAVLKAGTLTNHQGTVQGGGALTIDGRSLDNTAGRIVSLNGDDMTVTVTGQLTNAAGGAANGDQGGVIGGNGSVVVSAAALVNSGSITAKNALSVSGPAINNDHGTLAARAVELTTSGSLSNQGGWIESLGAATLKAGALTNQQGTVQSGGALTVDGSSLDNTAGRIVSLSGDELKVTATGKLINAGGTTAAGDQGGVIGGNGNATLKAATLTNSGSISAQNALTVSGQSFDNSSGSLSATQLGIVTDTLTNRGGRIVQKGAGNTTIAATHALDNALGTIRSNGANLDVRSAGLSNDGGTIYHGGNGGLSVTDGGMLSNRGGSIGSAGTLSVVAQSIDNTTGMLGAKGGAVSLSSASTLINDGGIVQGQAGLAAIAARAISNRGGKLESLGQSSALTLSGQSLDNTGGRVVNAGTSATRIAAGSITNANTGGQPGTGMLGGNGNVVIDSANVQNSANSQILSGGNLDFVNMNQLANAGQLTARGALTVNSPAAAVSNANGAISAANVELTVASLDNTHGQIANPAGSVGNIAIRTGTLTNGSGSIASTQDATINATSLVGEGRIFAGRDGSVSLQGDYTNGANNQITANRNVSLSTTGQLTNIGTLSAVGNLATHSNGLVNSGIMVSGTPGIDGTGATTLDAGAGDISNSGRIEGNAISTASQHLTNTGAIIGGTLSHAARTIVNDGSRAVMAGTQGVNLFASDEMTNRAGASIISLGDVNVAMNGQRDADGKLVNRTSVVNNLSSSIEAEGQLNIAADQLNNVRQNVATDTSTTTTSYTMKALPWWKTRWPGTVAPFEDANTGIANAYYVNPADIVSSEMIVTPDGNTATKLIVNLPANASVFQWKQSGLTYSRPNGGSQVQYQQDLRVTPDAGQVVLYAYNVMTGQPNPDQAGGTAWAARNYVNTVVENQLGHATYSNQYGNCTTNCVRIETYPDFTDPNTQMLKGTERRREGGLPLETQRIATQTVTSTTLRAGSGAPAVLTSGGAMNVSIGQRLLNDNGTIAAGGDLTVNGQNVPNGGSNAAIENRSTQLSTTYSFVNRSGYNSPDDPYPSAPAEWITWTNPSITMPTGVAGGTITSNRAVAIGGGDIRNTSVQATTGPMGVSAASLGLTAANLGTGAESGSLGVTGQATGSLSITGASSANTGTTGHVSGVPGVVQTVSGARTVIPSLTLPASGLFSIQAAPNQPYLVVTDPRFTSYTKFTSSDYMLGQLGLDPGSVAKRLGDGYYESRLVMEQITNLTGKRFLTGYTSNDDEYRQLMSNGAVFGKQFGVVPGVTLTDAQMAALTTDIVWLVNQTVTLPDGSQQTVLVPRVYLAKSNNVDLTPTGALIAGDTLGIAGKDVVNEGGTLSSKQNAVIVASNDIQNLGGAIDAGNLAMVAGNDIVNRSLTNTESARFVTGTSTHTSIGAPATIKSSGNLTMQAGRDLTIQGAQVSANSDLGVSAGRTINVDTVTTGSDIDTRNDERNASHWTNTNQVGSTLQAGQHLGMLSGGEIGVKGSTLKSGGDMALIGAGDVTIQGATNRSTIDLTAARDDNWSYDKGMLETSVASQLSAGGGVTVVAGQGTPGKNLSVLGSTIVAGTNGQGHGTIDLGASADIRIGETRTRASGDAAGHTESSGFLSSSSTDRSRIYAGDNSNGSLVSGDSVKASAGNDLVVHGSSVVGQHDVELSAKHNVDISATYDASQESNYYRHKKSGLMSSGGLGFTIGSSEQKARSDSQAVLQSQSRSTVGSVEGNVTVKAGADLHIGGSDLTAGKASGDTKNATGNIALTGQNVTIDPGRDDTRTHDQQESKSSGLTFAVTGTLFDSVRNLRDNASRGNGFQRAQCVVNEAGASMFDVPSISVTYGRRESKSSLDTAQLTNTGSAIRGAGNVSVIATGGAAKDAQGRATDGDIAVIGSAISAGGATLLDANRHVTLAASTDQYQQTSASSSSSTGIALLSSPSLGNLGRWIGGTANNDGVGPSPYNASRASSNGSMSVTQQTPTTVSGNTITVRSETGDVNVIGSGISGTQGVNVTAKQGAINVLAGLETSKSHQESSSRQIGNLGSNGTATGFSVGVASSHTVQDTASQTQSKVRSQIVSGGNVTLDAKQDVTVAGSDLMAGKDLALTGKNLNLDPGTDTTQSTMSQHSSQFGVSLALGGAIGNAVAAVNQSLGHPARGGDARLGALDKTQAALSVYSAYQVTSAFVATGKSQQAVVKATVSIGGGTNSSESHDSSLANAGSTLKAGENVKLIATGSGAKDEHGLVTDGDINARGTLISGRNVSLDAARDINLQSAKDTAQTSSSNRSSGGSIGVGAAIGGQQNGFTLELGGSMARGHANGESVTNRDSTIAAADTLSLTSGRDTNLRGAEVSGKTVDANVGRDLNIQSQQDTATYYGKQTSGGFQASVCVPPFCYGTTVSGSASASQQNITATFQSVNQQSGIYAGDGGYHVNVGKHTQLDGGAIASTAGAEKNSLSTQTFGHTNLENHASYSGETIGFAASGGFGKSSPEGVSFNTPAKQTAGNTSGPLNSQGLGPTGFSAAGTGHEASGTTYATVTPGAITVRGDAGTGRDSTTGLNRNASTANGAVKNTFDVRKVQNDLAVQQSVGQVGMQLVGTVATYLRDKAAIAQGKAKAALDDAKKSQDPETIAKAQADLDAADRQVAMWRDDGAGRVGGHAAVAGVAAALGGGNVAGAVGGTIAGDFVGTAVAQITGDTLGGSVISNAAAGAAGAVAGGALGGASGALGGAGGALSSDLYNRQLHDKEKKAIAEAGKSDAARARLTRAACYEVKCWADYPVGSEERNKNFVSEAEIATLQPELDWVKRQKEAGLFVYTPLQKVGDALMNDPIGVAKDAVKVGLGFVTAKTGGALCGSGLGCTVGSWMFAFGASDMIEGSTALMNRYDGISADGVNPLRLGFNKLNPTWGNAVYDGINFAFSIAAMRVQVPLNVGVADGLNRPVSMFGVTVPRIDNVNLFPFIKQPWPYGATQGFLLYGVGSKGATVVNDVRQTGDRK